MEGSDVAIEVEDHVLEAEPISDRISTWKNESDRNIVVPKVVVQNEGDAVETKLVFSERRSKKRNEQKKNVVGTKDTHVRVLDTQVFVFETKLIVFERRSKRRYE